MAHFVTEIAADPQMSLKYILPTTIWRHITMPEESESVNEVNGCDRWGGLLLQRDAKNLLNVDRYAPKNLHLIKQQTMYTIKKGIDIVFNCLDRY